jgi:hypothetical protein
MWSISTVECYSVTEKNKIISFAQISLELEIIMLSKIRKAEKNKYHIFSDLDLYNIIVIWHECKRVTIGWEPVEGGEGKEKVMRWMWSKRIIHVHASSIMKPTKNCKIGNGGGELRYNRGSEFDQSTLYVYMEI